MKVKVNVENGHTTKFYRLNHIKVNFEEFFQCHLCNTSYLPNYSLLQSNNIF